jgi:hypothetical protein
LAHPRPSGALFVPFTRRERFNLYASLMARTVRLFLRGSE